jgi:hypothetical protein
MQCRFPEGVDVVFLFSWHTTELHILLPIIVLVTVVFRLNDDSPSGGEDILVDIQFDGFEEVAAKDRLDGQILTIGQMQDTRSRSHSSGPFPGLG